MAVDNPSYFSVAGDDKAAAEKAKLFAQRPLKPNATVSMSTSLGNGDVFSRPLKIESPPKPEQHQYSDVASKNHYLVPNGSETSKKSIRSLLRSLSANAAHDAQSILAGEPRPSDIAPADHCAPFNPRSHRRPAHTRHTSESRHLMRKKTLEFCENEEVFYTMPMSNNSRRRHSIGAYLSKDRTPTKNLIKVTSVPSEVPRVNAPKVPSDGSPVFMASTGVVSKKVHPITTLQCEDPPLPISTISTGSFQRKKRNRCPSMREMENITIISSKDSPEAGVWVSYLMTCFNKMMSEKARKHYNIVSVNLEDLIDQTIDDPKVKSLAKAKLQILIVCPKLLLSVEQLPSENIAAFSAFQEERVLAMLLGVDDNSVNDDHKRAFTTYDYWQRMVMRDQDSTFVDKFLGAAVDILSKKIRNISENASFSIIPKKIKPGQNRVIALLNEPLTSEDVMTVHVEKKGELMQIKTYKKRNPYTLQFDVPDCCLEVSMLIWIKLEKNGTPLGSRQVKCESRLRELDQILRASDNPMDFMCQTLGFKTTDRDQLDSWMLTSFQKNIPPHFNLLSSPPHGNPKQNATSVDEYPTLLHFAARFGLERLCWQLLECPGGEAACDTRNVRHLTPADLAQSHGFPEIATVLRGFMQMNEFSNMYYLLKNMSEENPEAGQKKPKENDLNINKSNNVQKQQEPPTPDADLADPFSEECLHRLEAKQADIQKNLKLPNKIPELLYENDICNNSFVKDDVIQKAIEHDYLIQPSNRKVEIENLPVISRPKQIDLNFKDNSNLSLNQLKTPNNDFFDVRNNFQIGRANSLTSSASYPTSSDMHSVVTPTGQDELAEIIKDFKNNVFTISEVEKLVMDWQKRNETQQSLKEKQEQLNYMREEYDRLQKRIKDNMKRPTPFERVKKIFSKGKSKSKTGNLEINSNQRPNSGLSVHSASSSSSGRLSTASGVSIGESGTHSDTDEMKMFTRLTNSQDNSKLSIGKNPDFDDYLIPPPPRPLENNFQISPLPIMSPIKDFSLKSPHHMDTINEKEVFSSFSEVNYSNVKNQFGVTNNVSEHNYINVSPA